MNHSHTTVVYFLVLAGALLSGGCATTPPPDAEPAELLDVSALVSEEERRVQSDWVEYICSLPPERRAIEREAANTTYHASCPDDPQR